MRPALRSERRVRLATALAASVLLALGAAACSSSSGPSGSSAPKGTAGPSATSTSPVRSTSTDPRSDLDAPSLSFAHGWPKGSGGPCGKATPGRAGVIMTFCHGPARATFQTADGTFPKSAPLGGVCWLDAGHVEVDAGVTVGRGHAGPWPDYITLQAPATIGATNTSAVAWIGGTQHLFETANVTVAATGLASGAPIDATVLRTRHVTIALHGHDSIRGTAEAIAVACG